MATAAIWDFRNLEFLTIGRVTSVVLPNHAKLRRNSFNRDRDMVIFRFFKMAAAAILDFQHLKFLTF